MKKCLLCNNKTEGLALFCDSCISKPYYEKLIAICEYNKKYSKNYNKSKKNVKKEVFI